MGSLPSANPSSSLAIRTEKLLGWSSNTVAGLWSLRVTPRRWLTLCDSCQKLQRRFRRWAVGLARCSTDILLGSRHCSAGADCSIASINPLRQQGSCNSLKSRSEKFHGQFAKDFDIRRLLFCEHHLSHAA